MESDDENTVKDKEMCDWQALRRGMYGLRTQEGMYWAVNLNPALFEAKPQLPAICRVLGIPLDRFTGGHY